MPYWTLTEKGRSWADGFEDDPRVGVKVLQTLVDMLEESNVPRTEGQIARALGVADEPTLKVLKHLEEEGYVEETVPPKPRMGRPRYRPEEEDIIREIKERMAKERYAKSLKGIAARKRYWASPKGKAADKRYRTSQKFKEVMRRYRERRKKRIADASHG